MLVIFCWFFKYGLVGAIEHIKKKLNSNICGIKRENCLKKCLKTFLWPNNVIDPTILIENRYSEQNGNHDTSLK